MRSGFIAQRYRRAARRALLATVLCSGAGLCAHSTSAQVAWSGAVYPAPTQTTLSDALFVGYNTLGSLTINNGGVVQDYYGYLGYYPFGTGHATVDGNGSLWKNGRNLYVGNQGDATLTIQNGGRVESLYTSIAHGPGTNGQLIVKGAGSSLISTNGVEVSVDGQALLKIQQGGTVQTYSLRIGRNADSEAQVIVEDAGSTLDASVAIYGSVSPEPMLTIRNGGKVINGDAFMGYNNGLSSYALVDGVGSEWKTNRFEIGYENAGLAFVEARNGARLTTGNSVVGNFGEALVHVHGQDTRWQGWSYLVGVVADGEIRITDGATASGTRGFISIYDGDYRGLISVQGAGSTWSLSEYLRIGNEFNGTGEVRVTDGARVAVTKYLETYDNSAFHVSLDPAVFSAPITIGDNAQLAGTLTIEPATGATLVADHAYAVMSIGKTRTGQFAGLAEGDLVDVWFGLAFAITYAGGDGNDVWLNASSLTPGDLDGSGLVDQADLDIAISRFGQAVPAGHWTQGDADNDGLVGVNDLDIVLANWSNPATPPATVPEPATGLLPAMVMLLACRRRRASHHA